MAKLSGPLLSLGACGSLSKDLIYQTSKGRKTVKLFAVPTDRKSEAQLSVRSKFKAVSVFWTPLNRFVRYGDIARDGNFDSADDWDLGLGWSVFGNQAVSAIPEGTALRQFYETPPLVNGRSYRLRFDYNRTSASGTFFISVSGFGKQTINLGSSGSANQLILCLGETLPLRVIGLSGWQGTVENLSLVQDEFFPVEDFDTMNDSLGMKLSWKNEATWTATQKAPYLLFSTAAMRAGSAVDNPSFIEQVGSLNSSAVEFLAVGLTSLNKGNETGAFTAFIGSTARTLTIPLQSTGNPDLPAFDFSAHFAPGETVFVQIKKTAGSFSNVPRSGIFELVLS